MQQMLKNTTKTLAELMKVIEEFDVHRFDQKSMWKGGKMFELVQTKV